LIAWFSAGAFVILGFPMSMYGIVMHLSNYNQPNVQAYIVRILWMVPIYSIESWLCLRYKDYAIYIETLRDLYESYVLYSFLQFLIQVLGGEEALILMLKDKSPTRGVHMWGLQYCGLKPWLMGQPLRKVYMDSTTLLADESGTTSNEAALLYPPQQQHYPNLNNGNNGNISNNSRPLKRVHWTSPFFVKCKFGVLQYVLLKFICSIVVMILERNHWYHEGDFTYKGGYLYICVLTNLSQCWALYCLIFFYYATKNELAPIRPIGKFLSVKALVFFTWWQSVCISMLYQMDLIPHYQSFSTTVNNNNAGGGIGGLPDPTTNSFLPLSEEDAMALDEFGGDASFTTTPTTSSSLLGVGASVEWSSEDVAKGLQDYLICIEMFVAAIVHLFVFPHTEYDPQAVEARARALNQRPNKDWNKRLGRKWKEWDNKSGWSGNTNTSSEMELMVVPSSSSAAASAASTNMMMNNNNTAEGLSEALYNRTRTDSGGGDEDDLRIHPFDRIMEHGDDDHDDDDDDDAEDKPLLALEPVQDNYDDDDDDDDASQYSLESSELNDADSYQEDALPTPRRQIIRKPGFVKALLDSAIPQDLRDNTVGIIKGDYVVEKKTLLHHAATSDSYDLFSRVPKRKVTTTTQSKNIV
jgi:hypothetical protein